MTTYLQKLTFENENVDELLHNEEKMKQKDLVKINYASSEQFSKCERDELYAACIHREYTIPN